MDPKHVSLNRNSWNKRLDHHVDSEFYDMKGFLAGRNSLNDIELDLLGDVKGKKILHLQCHFGQDSLSLARMGAKVTGVDLADKAIEKAREINDEMDLDARFIACNVYDLPNHLDEEFDIIFTTYGTIGWLPDMDKWGAIVAQFLKPGGKLLLVEFHPVVWMFDSKFTKIEYAYFNTQTIVDTHTGTYADKTTKEEFTEVSWNHPLGEVMKGLWSNGLQITGFSEYDYSPYDCFAGMKKIGDRKFVIDRLGNKIPMVYALQAVK